RPLLVGELEERHDGLDARVVDEDVDGTELLPHAVDHGLDVGPARDVALHGDRPAAAAPDVGSGFLGLRGLADVVDGDVGALLGEDLGDAAADAAAAAGDERNLVLESHGDASPARRPPSSLPSARLSIIQNRDYRLPRYRNKRGGIAADRHAGRSGFAATISVWLGGPIPLSPRRH